jgi:dihydroorotase
VVVEKQLNVVDKSSILYHCGWSPFEGVTFSHKVTKTFVNGNLVWNNNQLVEGSVGSRMLFDR